MFETMIKTILSMAIPCILKLIQSKAVPAIKRKAYEKLDDKASDIIQDLAQNAAKISDETNEVKKTAYIEGTKLGIDTMRIVAQKLNTAADEIEKVL